MRVIPDLSERVARHWTISDDWRREPVWVASVCIENKVVLMALKWSYMLFRLGVHTGPGDPSCCLSPYHRGPLQFLFSPRRPLLTSRPFSLRFNSEIGGSDHRGMGPVPIRDGSPSPRRVSSGAVVCLGSGLPSRRYHSKYHASDIDVQAICGQSRGRICRLVTAQNVVSRESGILPKSNDFLERSPNKYFICRLGDEHAVLI